MKKTLGGKKSKDKILNFKEFDNMTIPQLKKELEKLNKQIRKKKKGGTVIKASKGSQIKTLTQRQKDTLKNHAEHHTPKHMAFMKKQMRSGKTFGAAHKAAMKKVGK